MLFIPLLFIFLFYDRYNFHKLIEYPFRLQGIYLLEDLAKKHSEGNRDYVYYLAIANARVKKYSVALKFCTAFLQIEPTNQQAITLEVSRIVIANMLNSFG